MGFFSWNCKVCRRSIRSPWASQPPASAWTTEVVAVSPTITLQGVYDGYGRIAPTAAAATAPPHNHDTPNLLALMDTPPGASVFHRACWQLVGSPGYVGPSSSALDQGFFLASRKPLPCPDKRNEAGCHLLLRWLKRHPRPLATSPATEAAHDR